MIPFIFGVSLKGIHLVAPGWGKLASPSNRAEREYYVVFSTNYANSHGIHVENHVRGNPLRRGPPQGISLTENFVNAFTLENSRTRR